MTWLILISIIKDITRLQVSEKIQTSPNVRINESYEEFIVKGYVNLIESLQYPRKNDKIFSMPKNSLQNYTLLIYQL